MGSIRRYYYFVMPTITIDVPQLLALGDQGPFAIMWFFFARGGWVAFVWVVLWGLWTMWVISRQIKYSKTLRWHLLAIDIPKANEQSPKAVEHIFSHLAGGLSSFTMKEKYWEGKFLPTFSLEIVSIEGYIQFLIRTQSKYRDLVEAAVYAQYPEAEIMEVEDYTPSVPRTFPSETHDLWGTEFVLAKKNVYPLRTYPQFEHSLSQEFKDPIASYLEALSRIRPGEQIWIQILIVPTRGEWAKAGQLEINKLMGRKEEKKPSALATVLEIPMRAAGELADMFLGGGATEQKEEKKEAPFRMLMISPGERGTLEAMEMKISKIGFATKIRFVYIAEKQVFDKGSRIALVKGAFQQFGSLDLNSFKNYGKVTPKSDYFWQRHKIFEHLTLGSYKTKHTRQMHLMGAYRRRDSFVGAPRYILNIEELATLFHFPQMIVKTPLIKKTEAKRAEPPFSLPRKGRPIAGGTP